MKQKTQKKRKLTLKQLENQASRLYWSEVRANIRYKIKTARKFAKQKTDYIG